MSKYQSIVSEIEKLQKSAEKVRKKELTKVIKDIKKEIAVFGLTASDLGFSGKESAKSASTQTNEVKRGPKPGKKRGRKRGRKAGKIGKAKAVGVAAQKVKAKVSPKFMHPETKQTWSGRGLRPRWLNEAISSGKKIEEFAV